MNRRLSRSSFFAPGDSSEQLPPEWKTVLVDEAIDQIRQGPRYDAKSVHPSGKVPVLDQSKTGYIGYHDSDPGVACSSERPVVTFANHTCNLRIITEPFSSIQNVFAFRGVQDETETAFLYYWLQGRISTDEYKGFFPTLRGMWLPLPPLDEQRRIAGVLGALDDLIEVNRGLIRQLAELSDAAFERWAKRVSDSVPLDQTMRRVVDGVVSQSLSSQAIYLGLEHFGTDATGLSGTGTTDGLASNKVKFNAGDVLYGKLRPYFRKVARPGFAGVCTTEAWVLRAKEPTTQEFVHWIARRENFTLMAMAGSEGTKMPRANWSHLSGLQVPDPADPGFAPVSQSVRSFWEAANSLEQEIAELQKTRDELLPLLMSGRIRVGEDVAA